MVYEYLRQKIDKDLKYYFYFGIKSKYREFEEIFEFPGRGTKNEEFKQVRCK